MRAVNLLPRDLAQNKSIREEDPAVVVGSALGVIVMIALSASFFNAHRTANSEQKRLTAARLELAAFSQKPRATNPKPVRTAPVTPIVPSPAITGEEASWLSAVGATLAQRIAWDRILREVSLVMPDDITLTALTMAAPTAAVAGAVPGTAPAQGFVVSGSAYSYDGVARLLSRLALVPDLSNITLANSTQSKTTGGAVSVQFSINATVKGAPAPPAAATPTLPATTGTTATAGVSS